MSKPNYKRGSLTDEEKRIIERMAPTSTYAQIARQLNRNPASVRKYCQRNGITDDIPSLRKQVEFKAKNNHHFTVLQTQLSKDEFDFAIQIYKGMMEQFGNDILYSEEVQIIEYCMVTCLLNRALTREKILNELLDEQRRARAEFQKKKDEIVKKVLSDKDFDPDADEDSDEEYYQEKIDLIDIRISEIQVEHRDVKKDQINFFDRKEKITKALNASRDDRAKELTKVNQNLGDLILTLKKNQQFRTQVGLELEKMRIGVKEEYIRLTTEHIFQDGEADHPIYNSEVAMRIKDEATNTNRIIYIKDEEDDGDIQSE